MKLLHLSGVHMLLSMFTHLLYYLYYRDTREAKRGGTAPGE